MPRWATRKLADLGHLSVPVSVQELGPAADAVTVTTYRTPAESAPASDGLGRAATQARGLTESAAAADTFNIGVSRSVAEAARATDSAVRGPVAGGVRNAGESAPASDAVGAVYALSDLARANDALTVVYSPGTFTPPVHPFDSGLPSRSGPGGSNLWRMITGTPTVTTTSRIHSSNNTGTWQLTPGVNQTPQTTIPAVGAAARNIGWREDAYLHPAQATLASRINAGNWTFTYQVQLTGGLVQVQGDFTVIVYAVSPSNTTRELFRSTATSQSVGTTETDIVQTVNPGALQLLPGELLQYEFYQLVTVNLNGNATTIFRTGTGSAAVISRIQTPSVTVARLYELADAAPAVDAVQRVYTAGGLGRAVADLAPAADAVSHSTVFPRVLAELARAVDAIGGGITLGELAAAADQLARLVVEGRMLGELARAVDAFVRFVVVARQLADLAAATDEVGRSAIMFRLLAETALAFDQVRRSGELHYFYGDQAPAADDLTRIPVIGRSLDDQAPAADLAARGQLTKVVSETAPADDATSRNGAWVRLLADQAHAGDAVTWLRALTDRNIGVRPSGRAYAGGRDDQTYTGAPTGRAAAGGRDDDAQPHVETVGATAGYERTG